MRLLKRLLIGWLVVAGLSTIAAMIVRRAIPESGTEDDDGFSVVAAMDGREFASRASPFRYGAVTAFMGGVELDMRAASIEESASLSVRAVMGGVDIVVPAQWRVELIRDVVMGGVENLTDPDASDTAPLLVIDAHVVMGGVEIHADGAT